MKKLLVAVLASAFALGSVAATVDNQTPGQPVEKAKPEKDSAEAAPEKAKLAERAQPQGIENVPLRTLDIDQTKAARALAQQRWGRMTPQAQMVMQEIAGRKHQDELTALDEVANRSIGWPRDGDFWTKRDRPMLEPVP